MKRLSSLFVLAIVAFCGGWIAYHLQTANAAPAKLAINFVRSKDKPKSNQDDVKKRVKTIVGLKNLDNAKFNFGSASDDTNPFININKRKVWRIFAKGEAIKRTIGKKTEMNKYISQFDVMVDDSTGSILQVHSMPNEGMIEIFTGKSIKKNFEANGLVFKEVSKFSGKPLLDILSSNTLQKFNIISDAKEIIAYPGLLTNRPSFESPRALGRVLLTDKIRAKEKIKNKPFWVIVVYGINSHFSSSGPFQKDGVSAKAPLKAFEALILVDAKTGKPYRTEIAGRDKISDTKK